ncbi:MAG TPA: hypothetical protein PKD54_03850 [Pirellulaceae bacterium]|nr:hypothetical protein [Pirellulaceae bacterium]
MATNIEQVAGYLDQLQLRYDRHPDQVSLITGFQTKHYVDSRGHNGILLVITVEENGEFIKFYAPGIYVYPPGPHTEAVMQTLLNICYITKMLQFEYDPKDGEIRAMIEFPVEDSTLTQRQVARCIGALASFADQYHAVVSAAIERGEKADEESFLRNEYNLRLAEIRERRGDIGLEG